MSSEGGFNPTSPVNSSSDFYNLRPLTYVINKGISENKKCTLLLGRQKGGKTSITNVLPEVIQTGYLPVSVTLDLLGPNPVFPMYAQVFNAIFRALIKREIIESDNPSHVAWSKQVNRGDLHVAIEDELLELGSRIAFYLNNPNSPITIDSGLLDSDWEKMHSFVKLKFPDFQNIVIILDNPKNLMLVDDQTRNSFIRLFASDKAPLLICALDIPSESEVEGSLFEFLRKSLPDDPNIFPLPVLGIDHVVDLLEKNHPELGQKSWIATAQKVHSITGGEPYLVKSLLQIAERRNRSSEEFNITAANCFELIQSQKANLSTADIEKLKALENLQKDDTSVFIAAANTILAISGSKGSLRNKRRLTRQLKTPKQIVLADHAPEAVYEKDIDVEVSDYLSQLKKIWHLGLFFSIDGDGKSINHSEHPGSELIEVNAKLSADTHPLILSYLQIAAKEINKDYQSPSPQGYFQNTSTRFAVDLTKFITGSEENSHFNRSFIRATDSQSRATNRVDSLSGEINRSITDLDYELFSSYFSSPIQLASKQNRFFSEKSTDVNKFAALTLLFSERNFPEIQEFAFLINVSRGKSIQKLEADVQSWIETKSVIMELSYSIELTEFTLVEVPEEFVEEVRFLSTRTDRESLYMSLFGDNNFQSLEVVLLPDLERELEALNKFDQDSELFRDFKSDIAQRMGYMAACCGGYSSAIKAFDLARKINFNSTIMIEDDKLVSYAYLGEIEKAVSISSEIIRMLGTKNMQQDEFWKLFFIPSESSLNFRGSVSMGPQAWPAFTYELQHATLLLVKKQTVPLTEPERDFLTKFDSLIADGDLYRFVSDKLPLHRLFACFLNLTGRKSEAIEILKRMTQHPNLFDALQVECAHIDLKNLEVDTSTGAKNG